MPRASEIITQSYLNGAANLGQLPVPFENRFAEVDAKLADIAISSRNYGAQWDGITDDTAAIQATIDAAPTGATILIGNCRLHGSLTVNKTLKFKGSSFVNANYTGAYPASKLMFDTASVPVAITANADISFEDIVVTGNQALGIDVISHSICLNNVVVQGFAKCIRVYHGYYNKWINSYIGFCNYAFDFDNCYNVNFVNMTIKATVSAGTLTNLSNLTIHGGSIEGFTNEGIKLLVGSRVCLFGTYFEGTTYTNNNSCVNLDVNCSVVAEGCHVYLSRTHHFIFTLTDNIRILSKYNTFVYPSDTTPVVVYGFPATLTASYIDISGDNWDTGAGVNVSYCPTAIFSNVATYEISYPIKHPLFGRNISTKNNTQKQSKTTPTVDDGTTVVYTNSGFVTDDPLGIHTSTWGYNPYRAIYQKGQWEKVGIRIPNQANTSGATLAQLETELNTLKTNLRANGVMI